MKKVLLAIVFFLGTVAYLQTEGQVRISVNLNLQPAWGPSGYNSARFYYLPDIDCYYDVNNRTFIYLVGRRWVTSHSLPPRYRGYDLYGGYKVVINDPRPYAKHGFYQRKYQHYKGFRGHQSLIRDAKVHDNTRFHPRDNHQGRKGHPRNNDQMDHGYRGE